MPDLPSGNLIVLFTDIEGRTALRERDRASGAHGWRRGGSAITQSRRPEEGKSVSSVTWKPRCS
jgi:hypothetical protein